MLYYVLRVKRNALNEYTTYAMESVCVSFECRLAFCQFHVDQQVRIRPICFDLQYLQLHISTKRCHFDMIQCPNVPQSCRIVWLYYDTLCNGFLYILLVQMQGTREQKKVTCPLVCIQHASSLYTNASFLSCNLHYEPP